MGGGKAEIEIVIPERLWNALKYIVIIFSLSIVVGVAFISFLHSNKNETSFFETIPEIVYPKLTPEEECEIEGNIWCNGKCYKPCPLGQRFKCPSIGEPICIITRSIEDIKKSVVHIRYEVTGCCDYYGQYSSRLGGSGSGIIYSKSGSTVYVITSRHVIDCVYAGSCLYPKSEKITIRTLDGNLYTPTKILYAPSNLDLAILQFESNNSIVPALIFNENITVGEKIIAIGYPSVGLESPEPILQFSITEGKITNIYDLLTYRGIAFRGIEIDAITDKGSSGGGVFNEDGQLIGIITWGDREQKITLAIDIKVLDAIKYFEGCPYGHYLLVEGGCCPYGTIRGDDGNCYEPCGKPNSYCPAPNICCNNVCYAPCPSGYVLGTDCICHLKCGDGYCPEGTICCNNKCYEQCPLGYYMTTDCKCRFLFT